MCIRDRNYFVVIGPNSVFPGAKTVRFDDILRPRGETILFVESIGRGVHWMEPADLDFDSMSFELNAIGLPSVSSGHRWGPSVCTVDCSILSLKDVRPDHLREMFLIRPEKGNKSSIAIGSLPNIALAFLKSFALERNSTSFHVTSAGEIGFTPHRQWAYPSPPRSA